ncbi:MAG: nitrogenase-stabilizing/protective protein NifW [Gammaproteobacteria bacterium]|nr:nitrogenase-stabilizing/protective protein NifW [Gammaproteobacteria bacterium]
MSNQAHHAATTPDNDNTFSETFAELESAEEYLDYFAIPFDAAVVHVHRLHILQRFHDYLASHRTTLATDPQPRTRYGELLQQAYNDFVHSNAQQEKVFRVFQTPEAGVTTISLSTMKAAINATGKV